MANYYTHASFTLECSTDQAKIAENAFNLLLNIDENAEEVIKEILKKDILKLTSFESIIRHCFLNHEFQNESQNNFDLSWEFEFVIDEYGIWISHSESICISEAALFTQAILLAFSLNVQILISFANICSQPRVDGFGGGCCIVSMSDIKFDHNNTFVLSEQYAFENKYKFYIRKITGIHPNMNNNLELITMQENSTSSINDSNPENFTEITPLEYEILKRYL